MTRPTSSRRFPASRKIYPLLSFLARATYVCQFFLTGFSVIISHHFLFHQKVLAIHQNKLRFLQTTFHDIVSKTTTTVTEIEKSNYSNRWLPPQDQRRISGGVQNRRTEAAWGEVLESSAALVVVWRRERFWSACSACWPFYHPISSFWLRRRK